MSKPHNRRLPVPEELEPRLALSSFATVAGHAATTRAAEVRIEPATSASVVGDANGDGSVGLDDLKIFAHAYLSHVGDAFYNPNVDFFHTGFISQPDGVLIEHHLTPLVPRRPLVVNFHLGPGQQIMAPHATVSGGATPLQDPTILGRTTPGALVFVDSPASDYSFTGPALVADEHGNFSVKVHNRDGLNNNDFLVFDSFGHQTIRDFPIIWTAMFDTHHPHRHPPLHHPTLTTG